MSLATRITLLVAAVLAASGLAAGVALHRAAARGLEAQTQGRLDARLAWLGWALDVELDDGELQLDARDEPPGAAEHWQVATADGRVLWSSAGRPPADAEALSRSRAASFGPAGAAPVAGASLVSADEAVEPTAAAPHRAGWAPVLLERVPEAAMDAARQAVPGLVPRGAEQKTRVKKKDADAPALFDIRGDAGGRRYDVRVTADGRVSRVRDRAADRFMEYEIAGAGDESAAARRVELVLTATTSAAAARAELAALSRLLWTAGPLAVLLTAALLALLIRWQLAPLARVAREAADIGPASSDRRIGPAGSSAELVRLRQAVNSMLQRLAEGLARERHFASTAAHELRTPLAQMRTAVEVALRRPREASEYRQTLEEVSADVERLQKLVAGLLHLARAGEPGLVRGSAVPLADLLRRVTERCAPGALGAAGADGVWILGDPELLQAAVCNVLENANRHAPQEPPSVRVEAGRSETRADGHVRVIVADRGPGIPLADRERVFQPLTRLDPSRAEGGFGLGLAVARTTARAFGGDLVCRPRSDGLNGTEFVFTFRTAAAAPASEDVGVTTED